MAARQTRNINELTGTGGSSLTSTRQRAEDIYLPGSLSRCYLFGACPLPCASAHVSARPCRSGCPHSWRCGACADKHRPNASSPSGGGALRGGVHHVLLSFWSSTSRMHHSPRLPAGPRRPQVGNILTQDSRYGRSGGPSMLSDQQASR